MSTKSNRHGNYTLEVNNQVVVTVCTGAWNRETVLDFGGDILDHAKQMPENTWGLICLANEWELGTPDALTTWNEYSINMQNSGMVSLALVMSANAVKKSVIVKNNVSPDHPEFKIEFFLESSDALKWSNAQVAPK